VWAVVVVELDEGVEQCLEVGDGRWLVLGTEPLLEGLLESFDFAARGWVVGSGVLLDDLVVDEFGFEGVASTASTGVSGGEDHAVVGEC